MWRAFKFCFSGLLLLLAGLIAFAYFGKPDSADMWGFFGFLIFSAAAPWVNYTKPSRAISLAGVVFAFGVVFIAVGVLTGSTPYPRECSGRGTLLCELLNLLYTMGGRPAAAAPWFLMALAVLYGSYVAFKRARAA
jgi:hypothetical protein